MVFYSFDSVVCSRYRGKTLGFVILKEFDQEKSEVMSEVDTGSSAICVHSEFEISVLAPEGAKPCDFEDTVDNGLIGAVRNSGIEITKLKRKQISFSREHRRLIAAVSVSAVKKVETAAETVLLSVGNGMELGCTKFELSQEYKISELPTVSDGIRTYVSGKRPDRLIVSGLISHQNFQSSFHYLTSIAGEGAVSVSCEGYQNSMRLIVCWAEKNLDESFSKFELVFCEELSI